MPLSHIEHFLLQTEDMEKTKDWYCNVLGMTVGYAPDFKFPVYWLYIGDKDVVHITQGGAKASANRTAYLGEQSTASSGSGLVDHIAFRATGLHEMIARLESLGVEFNQRRVDEQSLYQLFLFDPNGVKIELNFAAAETAGLRAGVVAADLDDPA